MCYCADRLYWRSNYFSYFERPKMPQVHAQWLLRVFSGGGNVMISIVFTPRLWLQFHLHPSKDAFEWQYKGQYQFTKIVRTLQMRPTFSQFGGGTTCTLCTHSVSQNAVRASASFQGFIERRPASTSKMRIKCKYSKITKYFLLLLYLLIVMSNAIYFKLNKKI